MIMMITMRTIRMMRIFSLLSLFSLKSLSSNPITTGSKPRKYRYYPNNNILIRREVMRREA